MKQHQDEYSQRHQTANVTSMFDNRLLDRMGSPSSYQEPNNTTKSQDSSKAIYGNNGKGITFQGEWNTCPPGNVKGSNPSDYTTHKPYNESFPEHSVISLVVVMSVRYS